MSNDSTPATRREIFTAIASAATRDLLPVPTGIAFGDKHVFLEFDRRLDVNAWSDHLQAVDRPDILTEDGKRRIIVSDAPYWGWRLRLRAVEDVQSDVASSTCRHVRR